MSQQMTDLKAGFKAAGIEIETSFGRGLTKGALIVEGDYKVRLTKGGHVASGLLRGSASHRLIERNGYPAAQIGPGAAYGKEFELGGPPRYVPVEDILKWVIRKGLVGRSGKNNRRTKSDKSNEETLAYLIQRSIQEKGTMPHPTLLPALVSNRAAIFKAVAEPMRATLAKKGLSNAS